jgi:Animal haem peroxidase
MVSTRHWSRLRGWGAVACGIVLLFAVGEGVAFAAEPTPPPVSFEVRKLNGSGNNPFHPTWGEAGQNFLRLAPAHYADGIGQEVAGPNTRYISNRVFNALGIDVFSPRNVSQWVWIWGQFMDHNIELALGGGEEDNIPFNGADPLEEFTDTIGVIPFTRNTIAPGTGTSTSNPRQQVNTSPTFIDGFTVYGGTQSRLEWLRTGPDNGIPAAAGPELMLPGGYLPLATARGNAATAPSMKTEGQLEAEPQKAIITGDERGNENAELTALTTLFAREHNRIVSKLPKTLSAEEKFQIARRVVGAEMQYITYTAFLPAAGVVLPAYKGYNPAVNPAVNDEFGTVGFRAHSMVNGEEEIEVPASRFTPAQITAIEQAGISVEKITFQGKPGLKITVTQSDAFFHPAVVPTVGLQTIIEGFSQTPNYRNDEQIDNALRSVLFEIPASPEVSEEECFEDPETPGCFSGVVDLGAIDAQRGRDNGIPSYNEMRKALGLAPQKTFDEVTGNSSETLPAGETIESPGIMAFTKLENFFHEQIAINSEAPQRATYDTRASTLAARLKAIYGSVENMDAFVGMVSEPSLAGSELGEVQTASWKKQFENLRNGDRFFYLNDPQLAKIKAKYGISFQRTLAELAVEDAGVSKTSIPANVFFAPTPARAKH